MAPFPDDDIHSCDSVQEFPDSFPPVFKTKTKQQLQKHHTIKPHVFVNVSKKYLWPKIKPYNFDGSLKHTCRVFSWTDLKLLWREC